MDDSAHGDEPAEPKDAGSAKARLDTPLREHTPEREPVADAIPTVTPHPPRLPSQVPPWLEETVAAGTAGDVPAGADEAQARVQDAIGPPPEVPVTPITLEPFSPPAPPAAVVDDDGGREVGAVNPAPEMPDQSAALQSPAPPADADGVGSREIPTTEREPESEAVAEPDEDAEPAQHAVFTAEGAPPAHVEAPSGVPSVGEAPVESPSASGGRPRGACRPRSCSSHCVRH